MSSLKAMPCISNSKVAIFNCFTRPQLPSHSPIQLSTLWGHPVTIFDRTRIASQVQTGLTHSSRLHACCGDAFRGIKKRNPSSGCCWGFETGRSVWESPASSSGSNVRTFASSPQGSDGSGDAEMKNGQASVKRILGKGLFVGAAEALEERLNKPEICTADELHYVAVPGTHWRLALWHYRPAPNAPERNHPLLLLSGIGTNALGFDLDPSVSMARFMAGAGFDTWILEVRGAGLSKSAEELAEQGKPTETSNGAMADNKRAPDAVKVNPPTNESTEEQIEAKLDAPNKGSSEVTSEEGNVAKMDSPSKRPREATDDEGSVGNMDPATKKSIKPAVDEIKSTDSGDIFELSLKAVRGGASWDTATRLTNTIVLLSNRLKRLLTQGQSKILSTRFIDSVVSLFEESALSKRIIGLRERLANLLEAQENSSTVVTQLADLRKKLAQLLEDGQDAVSPRVTNLQERLSGTVDDFQRIVDLIAKYDWDFDDYLEEDVPTAMEYIRNRCKPVDGKLLSVGHSMGGIVLYALLSTRGDQAGLAGAVALASALDYQCSNTSLKLLLPLTDPAQVFNVPVVPLGGLMTVVHPLVTRPPYALAWLGYNVSAKNMMEPELFSKLVLNNFGTIPVKLLLHLVTVFQPEGLANRDGTIRYKENIGKVNIPVLAIAGDQDLICPPPAVLDTVESFPKETITYKCFGGGENDRHYGHYDIVCSPGAKEEVFPVVLDFLVQNDKVLSSKEVKVGVEV